ncbi:MAG TPA: peptidoglycan-binding domain-containing protein [Nocardioidaceae bacterium]|nr:peptidoglycan-binding domain-containing protein [Nocardioidaceae bacterium]
MHDLPEQPDRSRAPRRSRAVTLVVVMATVAGLGTAVSIAPAAATTGSRVSAPMPRVPSGLPHRIEGLADYVPAVSCQPVVRPGVRELGRLLTRTYSGTNFQVTRTCGTDSLPTSEHYDGRALDWMGVSARTRKGRARAHAVMHWLFARDDSGHRFANARRIGVMYVIWNNRIWGAYSSEEGWRPYWNCAQKKYRGRAYDTTCHRNHVHFSLSWDGARGRTSFWTKRVVAPDYGPCRRKDMNWAGRYRRPNDTRCQDYPHVRAPRRASRLDKTLTAYSGMWLHRGSRGPAVTAVQRAVHAAPTGRFTRATVRVVRHWQHRHHLNRTGTANIATWRALLKSNAP